MNVRELKQILDDLDDDTEVRIAHQPSWPFEYSISEVVESSSNDDDIEDVENALKTDLTDDEKEEANAELQRLEEENVTIVYIAEGTQIGYLPGAVTKQLGWGRR